MGAAAAIAGIGAVGSLASGIMGSGAASKAAGQESAAIGQGIDFQKQVYGQGQTNLQPFIGGGQSALAQLLGFYGLPGGNASGATQAFQQFQNTPSYQFPLQQGQLAVNRQLASSGLIGSGAALRDASQLNTGYASAGLQQYLAGLSGIAGSGQSAAGTLLTGGNQAASTVGGLYTNQGGAQATGTIGSNNAITNGLSNGLGGLLGAATSTNGFGLGSSSYGNSGWGGSVPTTPGDLSGYGVNAASYNSSGAPIQMGGS